MKRHQQRIVKKSTLTALVSAWMVGMGGCSTTDIKPLPPPKISPPDYVQVPHPEGFDINDVVVLLKDPRALTAEAVKTCDADFLKLRTLTQSEDEVRQGTREMVKADPLLFHWCFYGKVIELEQTLKTSSYIDEKQKKVLDTYAFLVPVARGFMQQFHDSRYLRWAIRHYRSLSQVVFYSKVNQSPQMTAELTEVINPFGLWRETASSAGSVLEKYHMARTPVMPEVMVGPTLGVPTVGASPSAGMIFPPAGQPLNSAIIPDEIHPEEPPTGTFAPVPVAPQ